MLSIQTILHPTDFNESSMHALNLACALASDYRAKLVIVHVVAAPIILPDGVIVPIPEQGNDEFREHLGNLEIPDDRIGVVRRLEEGNPAVEILNLARFCHADLIVMGSHRRSGLTRWFMGSVADAVMREATCPVLIVTSSFGRSNSAPHQDETHAVPV